jgi:hypothetical protein
MQAEGSELKIRIREVFLFYNTNRALKPFKGNKSNFTNQAHFEIKAICS